MSAEEASSLITWGRHWFSHVWIGQNHVERDRLITHVNNDLNAIGFRLGRGWQPYDPVIRRAGRPSSYLQIATWAYARPNHGAAEAQIFLNWTTDVNTTLYDLPIQLKDFAIITHLAEVARGYSRALVDELYPWMADIVDGQRSWGDYNDFSPSLRFLEDTLQEWEEGE